jgi:hypothetical protein
VRDLRTKCWMIFALVGLFQISHPALSQTSEHAAQPPAAPTPTEKSMLKPAELVALVAPIALYPDTLLANVLMASTYPLEVVRAERWLKDNSKLKGDDLKAAAEKQDWDESVKALVAAPSVLEMMSERLDWMQKLGEAFLAQEQDVMDAVQRLRAKAHDRRLKHDVVLLGWLDNGLGYCRFAYNGSKKVYVGVIAQEVSVVRPDAVARGPDGYLRVSYERLGLNFRSYDDWTASGAKLPQTADPPL